MQGFNALTDAHEIATNRGAIGDMLSQIMAIIIEVRDLFEP